LEHVEVLKVTGFVAFCVASTLLWKIFCNFVTCSMELLVTDAFERHFCRTDRRRIELIQLVTDSC